MKIPKTMILMLLLLSFFIQCKNNPNKPAVEDGIFGNWSWDRSCGGFSGETIYADSVDYTRAVYIGQNMTISQMQDDSILYSSDFTLEDSITVNNDTLTLIVVSNYPAVQGQFKWTVEYVDQDSLILVDGCDDCYTNKYHRLGPI